MPDQLFTPDEVAERFRTTTNTLKYWRYVGAGPQYISTGRRVLYSEADLDAWVEQQRQKQKTSPAA